jgi:hypothetical protein
MQMGAEWFVLMAASVLCLAIPVGLIVWLVVRPSPRR